MFNPLKALGDVNQMRKQAKQIQDALEQEEFDVTEGSVRVVMTGNQNVKRVEIDGVESGDATRAINGAIKKSQQAAAMKLAQMSKDLGQ